MKYFFLLPLMIAASFTATAQTLITYGKNTVSADEFMRAYNKNKTPVPDKTQALKEYMDLYTNFKLKVKSASELRLDTLPHIKADIDNFRSQIQDNYLVDEKAMTDLYTEAYNRSKKDIHVIHFSVAVSEGSTPSDTMKAFKAIQQIVASLEKGNSDYQLLADNSSAIYPSKYSDFGFVTAFTLPYQYENIVYQLKPSQVSKPYRSKGAWHIFKLIEERPAAGKWKIAQILFSFPPSAEDQLRISTQNEADSVYRLL